MTVAELIARLQALPPNAVCKVYEEQEVDWVEITEANLVSDLVVHLETSYDSF